MQMQRIHIHTARVNKMHPIGPFFFFGEIFFGLHKLGRSRISLGNLIHIHHKLVQKKKFGQEECSMTGHVSSDLICVCLYDMISQHLGNLGKNTK